MNGMPHAAPQPSTTRSGKDPGGLPPSRWSPAHAARAAGDYAGTGVSWPLSSTSCLSRHLDLFAGRLRHGSRLVPPWIGPLVRYTGGLRLHQSHPRAGVGAPCSFDVLTPVQTLGFSSLVSAHAVVTTCSRLDHSGMPELLESSPEPPGRRRRAAAGATGQLVGHHHGLPRSSPSMTTGVISRLRGTDRPRRVADVSSWPRRRACRCDRGQGVRQPSTALRRGRGAAIERHRDVPRRLGPQARRALRGPSPRSCWAPGEPFWLMAIESMATGTPVIARRILGSPDNRHNVTGSGR
jgi:hypothetical protein